MTPSAFTTSREPVTDPESVLLRREYLDEVVSRYHGRPAAPAEIEAELADQPGDDLVEPRGAFLVLRDGKAALGCVGVRLLSDELVELKSLFVRKEHRRCGAGKALVVAAEKTGRAFEARWIRLDTRGDLTESRALYKASGFTEISAYNKEKYAEHWFEKDLFISVGGRI